MKKLREIVENDLDKFLDKEKKRFSKSEYLKIDLHCHDHNSSVPDEKLGRILGVPETWLPSERLISSLGENGCNAYTITNHNNAKSCFELQQKGMDILTGAEFSVKVPDFNTGIHVLTYGFSPDDEKKLNKLRDNLYMFLAYCREKDIPTIWAHPLYHYKSGPVPQMELFEKLSVIFSRFEVLNGQRDSWQNMLIYSYLNSLDEAKINSFIKKHKIDWKRFTDTPYEKAFSGGSDDHMGIFAGMSGAYLGVADLTKRLKTAKASDLALEAIRERRMGVFGSHQDHEKMTVAFIDYFCQIGLNMKDPGLFRILLHKGEAKEKLLAFLIANGFGELKRHKMTMRFLQTFHDAFAGKAPSPLLTLFIKKDYRDVIRQVSKIASVKSLPSHKRAGEYQNAIELIYKNLIELLSARALEKVKNMPSESEAGMPDFAAIIEKIEIPSIVRNLSSGSKGAMSEMLDGLSFPALATTVLAAANFASTKVLYNTRPLLKKFSDHTGKYKHPQRMLWLTDTFEDNNGVAMVLRSMLDEIRRRKLPIDICVCSSKLKSEENLIVLKPVTEFTLPFYKQQPIRIPNLIELHNVFMKNEYDRVMASTEGFMGMASLYLKNAFSVPSYFYVHTDWMTFAKKVLSFESENSARMKRLLRAFYGQYDKIFVLNSDQREWFTSSKMGFSKSQVSLTAHWVDDVFTPKKDSREKLFGLSADTQVLLFTGRLSEEKGVDELPAIYEALKRDYPKLRMVLAGSGPAEDYLKKSMPDAIFLGWVDHSKLPQIYSSADMLILPSKFDTFGCVVLEALSCSLPVISYNTKGPREIIENGVCGYAVANRREMIQQCAAFFRDKKLREKMKKGAVERSRYFSKERIMKEFLSDISL